MTTFPGSPRLLKGGIVLLDPKTMEVQRIIVLQYNPDSLSRTLQPQTIGGEGGDRLEALRLKGPPIETIKLEAELDATDQLEFPDRFPNVVKAGIYPQLAALETLLYPKHQAVQLNRKLAAAGTLEIAPTEAPLTLFIWSRNRILPVRLTEFSITEEAFDSQLNPLRAKISLGLRVLSTSDLPTDHPGSTLFMNYYQQKELLAQPGSSRSLSDLGLERIL